jgi:hypothetical protein
MSNHLLRLACVLVLALAGCGGGGENSTATATPGAPAAPVAAPAPPPTVLKGGIQLLAGDPGTGGVFDRKGDDNVLGDLQAIASDAAGNLIVAGSSTIRKISPQRVVTQLSAGGAAGLVVDPAGNIFYTSGYFLKKITPAGVTSTVVGAEPAPPSCGCTCGCTGLPTPPLVDGDKATARFGDLGAIARDKAGNFYVTDRDTLRRISPAGDVVTIAGVPAASGIAVDAAGNVYLTGDKVVRKLAPNGVVSTLAGKVGVSGTKDGAGTEALFAGPQAITIDDAGNLYVTDSDCFVAFSECAGPRVRKISAAGVVSTLSTAPPQMFAADAGITHDSAGNIYVTHYTLIERISPAGARQPWVGSRWAENTEPLDGTGSAALFAYPSKIASDAQGNAYVVDNGLYVRKVAADGKVTTLAGAGRTKEAVDGTGSAASFDQIEAIAVDAAGSVYVVDNDAVRKVSQAGVVTTIAGNVMGWGYADGSAAQARFSSPSGIAVDGNGNIYVSDLLNDVVRKITPGGQVSTLAGAAGQRGSADGKGAAARFGVLETMFVDAQGNVYVNDLDNGLRKITADGTVTTVAGTPQLGLKWGAVDAAGSFYGANGSSVIRKLTPDGVLSTVAGTPDVSAIRLGDLPGGLADSYTLAMLPPLPNTIGTRLLVVSGRALLLVTVPGAP